MDATLDMHGWEDISTYLQNHDLPPDSVFLFTHKWFLSGEVDLATAGKFRVMCFDEKDPRGYGVWDKKVDVIGKDGIGIYSNRFAVNAQERFGKYFQSVDAPDSLIVERGGVRAKTFYFVRCRNLLQKYEAPF